MLMIFKSYLKIMQTNGSKFKISPIQIISIGKLHMHMLCFIKSPLF